MIRRVGLWVGALLPFFVFTTMMCLALGLKVFLASFGLVAGFIGMIMLSTWSFDKLDRHS